VSERAATESVVPEIEHELFVVEGESAADALRQVCQPDEQHVHAIQGKPMNVFRASTKAIWANDRVSGLHFKIIGSPSAHLLPDYVSYRRVILLTDANVDGVHAKALLLGIFAKVMPELIEEGRLFTIRAPEYAVRCAERTAPVFAYSQDGRQSVLNQLADRGATKLSTQHYAGLAGMSDSELALAFTNHESSQRGDGRVCSDAACAHNGVDDRSVEFAGGDGIE